MSMISKQVKELRELSQQYPVNISIDLFERTLNQAADTIESLSAKLQAANMERPKANYSIGDLSGLIDKFDNEKIKGITDFEQVEIFNALKYLDMYQKIGTISEFMDLKSDKAVVEKIISTIEKEMENSNHTQYKCNDGSVILTDVGYVEEWFDEYKDILRERYCK